MQDNWEVEQKYHVRNEAQLRDSLEKLGFESQEVEAHCDQYFRHPCRNFRKTDEAFRLRRLNSETYVTYKGPRLADKVKTRPELELQLVTAEHAQWQQMLRHLGFGPLPEVRKTRTVFGLGVQYSHDTGCVVCLDEVEELGLFAEIELLVKNRDELPEAQVRIERLAAQLGLVEVQQKSYLALLLEKLGIE